MIKPMKHKPPAMNNILIYIAIITTNNQRLRSAGDSALRRRFHVTDSQNTRDQITRDRRSKHAWSNCVLCIPFILRDGPLENLWGGGGAGLAKYKKKYSSKGRLNEKNSCTPINPKKYSFYGLKKIYARNLIPKKNSCGSKIPLPCP